MPNPLAQEILDRITANPKAFDPGRTGFTSVLGHAVWPEDDITEDDITMGIAGWACHLSNWRMSTDDFGLAWAFEEGWEERRSVLELAMELLGLDSVALLEEEDRDAAIAGLRALASAPLTDQPITATCTTCGQPCGWIDCPTGGWWAHDGHPADGHDAAPACSCAAETVHQAGCPAATEETS